MQHPTCSHAHDTVQIDTDGPQHICRSQHNVHLSPSAMSHAATWSPLFPSPHVTTYVTTVMCPLPSNTHPTRQPACFPAPAPTSPPHISSPSSAHVTMFVMTVTHPLPSNMHPTRPACFPAPALTSPPHVSTPRSQTDHPHIPCSCTEPLPCATPMNSHACTCPHACNEPHVTPTCLGHAIPTNSPVWMHPHAHDEL